MLKSRLSMKTRPAKPTLERKNPRQFMPKSWFAATTITIFTVITFFKDFANLIHTLVEIYKAFN